MPFPGHLGPANGGKSSEPPRICRRTVSPIGAEARPDGTSECDTDTGSTGRSVFCDDRTPMGNNDRRNDRETETGAAMISGSTGVGAPEPLERMWEEGRVEPWSVVRYLEPEILIHCPGT